MLHSIYNMKLVKKLAYIKSIRIDFMKKNMLYNSIRDTYIIYLVHINSRCCYVVIFLRIVILK